MLCSRPRTFPLCTAPTKDFKSYTLSTVTLITKSYYVFGIGFNNGTRQKGGAARRFPHQDLPGCRPSLARANRKGIGSISHDNLSHQAQLRPIQRSYPPSLGVKGRPPAFTPQQQGASEMSIDIPWLIFAVAITHTTNVLCSTFYPCSMSGRT